MRINHYIGQHDWKAMPQKIDVIDKKIAFLLCKNSRLSNTAIAKALKIKREVVSYRIKKMVERDFLYGFITRINPRKLGFMIHFVYLKLKTPSNEKELMNELVEHPEITNLKNVGGRFDIYMEITTKNVEEFDHFLRKILDKHGEMVHDYSILQSVSEKPMDLDLLLEENNKELNRLKTLTESKGSSFHKELETQSKDNHPVELETLDKQILNIIKLNCRSNLKDIAKEVHSNYPLVHRKIKKMIENGVITTFTIFFSLAHLGLQMYPVLFNLRNLDENKFLTYLDSHPYVLWSHKLVGNWNYQVNIFARNNAHFHDILNDIRENFSENIVSFDTMMVFSSLKAVQRVD
ncbi:MAG: Lrp/AsnC family transcriptional regulator [Candidatus Woesearchaeota archaeon]